MFFGHLSFKLYNLVKPLHFSTHASSKQNSQRQNMVNFYSIKHRKFNLRFFCCSVYFVQKIWSNDRSLVVMFLAGAAKTSALHIVSGEIHPQLKASKSMLHNGVRADLICRINLLIHVIIALDTSQQYNVHLQTRLYRTQKCALDRDILRCKTFK